MTRKVAYVVHPVTAAQKEALVNQGYKIVDARFAPAGAEIVDPNAKKSLRKPKVDAGAQELAEAVKRAEQLTQQGQG